LRGAAFLPTCVAATLLCAAALAVAPPVRADAADDKVAELRAAEKDEAKCVAKLEELKDAPEAKIVAAIRDLSRAKSDKVACTATRIAANRRPADLDFQKALLSRTDDKDLFDAKSGRPELYLASLDGLVAAPYRESQDAITNVKKALGGIERLIHKFAPSRSDYASRLAQVYGMVLERQTVENLVKIAESLDSTGGSGGGGSGGTGGKQGGADVKKSMGDTKFAVMKVMSVMTGQDIADVPGWRKWWNEKGKTFEFQASGAAPPTAAVAPAKIVADAAEYRDEVYGFACKRPEDAYWSWLKPDFDAARVMLACRDPVDPNPRSQFALVYFILHDTTTASPYDVKSFAKWIMDEAFKTQLSFDARHVPTTEIQKQGGVEWTVVKAKGEGLGSRKGWGVHERRVYIVKIGTQILWVDACIRLSANSEMQSALWHSLDSMTVLPPAKKK
jgi:hypothetical protein